MKCYDALNLLGNAINNVATPAVGTDVATKAYVDSATSGAVAQSVGDAVAQAYTVTHNLNTTDVLVDVFEVATGDTVYPRVTRGTVNAVTVTFEIVPSANQYRVLVRK